MEETNNQVARALEKLSASLASGQLKAATRHHKHAKQLIEQTPATGSQQGAFAALTRQLGELKDWQGFATRPKRIELCERMQALAEDVSIPAPEKARAIKELQHAWQALGPYDSPECRKLWQKFKRYGDAAYAPCASHFDALREKREENAQAIEACIESIARYETDTDWSSPNFKAVSNFINRSVRTWQKHSELPPGRFRNLKNTFDRALSPIRDRLKAEQNRNHALKSDIVEKAKASAGATDEDLAQAVNNIKSLQAAWKDIGITDRRRDQKLWKAFRGHCDVVFARRDAARTAATKSPSNPEESVKRRDRPASEKRTPDSLLGLKIIEEMKRRAAVCIQLEAGQIDPASANETWNGDIELPEWIERRLVARRNRVERVKECDRIRHREIAEQLCVRMEILAGIDSPPEANEQRLRFQVERLNRELSQGQKETRSPREQAEAAMVDWYCLGPLPHGSGKLCDRFYRAEKVLIGSG